MRIRDFALVVLVFWVLILTGCKSGGTAAADKAKVPMGDKAPEFGSTPALKTTEGFLVGRWTRSSGIDADLARQLKVESLPRETIVEEVWEFSPDGSFTYSDVNEQYVFAGTWAKTASGVTLKYQTLNGKPIKQVIAQNTQNAEKGYSGAIRASFILESFQKDEGKMMNLSLYSDKKMLQFENPSADNPLTGGIRLERLGKE